MVMFPSSGLLALTALVFTQVCFIRRCDMRNNPRDRGQGIERRYFFYVIPDSFRQQLDSWSVTDTICRSISSTGDSVSGF
ncbi:hypothetical protein BJ166DRAFT_526045 [Pestalotiopsis sp. NC0098]|nr:hypothetical protein BJ166DRAFT_526045 [Pestalotiopsis sp. NC0098]